MRSLARDADRAEIRRRIGDVRPDSPRQWGRMSAHQMVCHLNDSFRVALGEKEASAASGVVQRTLVRWVALYVPARWPPGIATRPEIDQEAGGTRPARFEEDLNDLGQLFERFVQTATARGPLAIHPIFGRLTPREWLRWGYLHTDHHLRQFGK